MLYENCYAELQQHLEDWRRREEEQRMTAKRFQRDEVLSGAFIRRWLANRGYLFVCFFSVAV
jgi:hypothetical protein